MSAAPRDLAERERALDPRASFIVQAPAGSGKTELLIQRYLRLLSHVQQPEEIAAITFTRKSAAEMRRRVLQALAAARAPRPVEPHRALTWQCAREALERDAALGWHLEESAARLRIQTIDALCASLTRQMPLVSSFVAQAQTAQDPLPLYREAAEATLVLLEEGGSTADDVARMLRHLDNNVGVAMDLLISMLSRRDQWLRAVARGLEREPMEHGLRAERREAAGRVQRLFQELAPIRFESAVDDPAAWQRIAEDLLTKKGDWRKRSRDAAVLEGTPHADALRDALRGLLRLPPERYTDAQWEALGAIARLLPVAVAQLKLVFAAHGYSDFVEVAQGALAALGDPEQPTDLLLALDYRIHHLLVDEFQDTSYTQYDLLQRLSAGWEAGDGRTLFLVGDPMQSIYRFREADVGLFLRVRREGLGSVKPEALLLSANFRSQAGIVDWVNATFARVLPAEEDLSCGAVPYAASHSVQGAGGSVSVHAFFNGDAQGEAKRVAQVIMLARERAPEETIAVLVRTRADLEAIVPQLCEQGVRFRAIEIEPLGHRQAVQDLLALARALSHPADRLAWLAVLRAPWCGLSLTDAQALLGAEAGPVAHPGEEPLDLFPETLGARAPRPNALIEVHTRTPWELVHEAPRVARLGTDGQARLARLLNVLDPAMVERLRGSLRERVEDAWLALSGPACLEEDTDLEDAEAFFDTLQQSEEAGELADPLAFEEAIETLYARPDVHAGGEVQLLTIHKAKGLEFDTVIVPGLGSPPRHRDPSLLLWSERSGDHGRSRLLLAPVKETGSTGDPIYDYLVRLDEEKERHEQARLLYVAATRAKKNLHLLGDTRCVEHHGTVEIKPPSSGSLLEKLWPTLEGEFQTPPPAGGAGGTPVAQLIDQRLRRLPLEWTLPVPEPLACPLAAPAAVRESIEFSWAGETARHIGSVVHRWLQRIGGDALQGWDRSRVESLREFVRKELSCRGVASEELPQACARVIDALMTSLSDARGRWVLGPQRDARCELRLASIVEGRRTLGVIDRVFTDEAGVRWIVDYKTSLHQGGGREAFLDRECDRYRPQLERYARLLGGGAALGLYFPLLGGWREWRAP